MENLWLETVLPPYEVPVYPTDFLTYGVSVGKIEQASCQSEGVQTFSNTPGKVLDAPVAWWTSLHHKKSHATSVEKSVYYYYNM